MNCNNYCKKFFETNDEKYLGNITDPTSCSNCLYWKTGPGWPLWTNNNSRCECGNMLTAYTNGGTKNLTMQEYNNVKKCLENDLQTCGPYNTDCGQYYNNFTNIPPQFIREPNTVMKPCNPNQVWSYKFYPSGVL